MTVASDEKEDWPSVTTGAGLGQETFHAIQHLNAHDIQVPPGWAEKGLNLGGHRTAKWWTSQLKFPAAFDYFADHGQYDWYLYGDDDTYFFLDNIADFVSAHDHNAPHVFAHVFPLDDGMDFVKCGAGRLTTFGHGGKCLLSHSAPFQLPVA
jgi:hypothetical protein